MRAALRIVAFLFGVALISTFVMRVGQAAPAFALPMLACPSASAYLQVHGYDGPQTVDLCVTALQITTPARILVAGVDWVGGTHALILRVSQMGYTLGVLNATGFDPTAAGVFRSSFDAASAK
jgi:hypothetical protein